MTIEQIITLLIESSGADLNEEQKEELKAFIFSLPECENIASLNEEVKRSEAEKLGVSEAEFEALLPLLIALHGIKSERAGHIIDEFHIAQRFRLEREIKQ